LDLRLAGGTCEEFFGQSHKGCHYHTGPPSRANGFLRVRTSAFQLAERAPTGCCRPP
jgi:hypothetical protein